MTDIIKVAKLCGGKDAMIEWRFTFDSLQAFADHYRKEGAEESGKVFEQRWETAKLSSKTIVGLREQLAATELVVEQMREALKDVLHKFETGGSVRGAIVEALQLQSSLSALRDQLSAAKQEGYDQGKQEERSAWEMNYHKSFLQGKQAGRDEALKRENKRLKTGEEISPYMSGYIRNLIETRDSLERERAMLVQFVQYCSDGNYYVHMDEIEEAAKVLLSATEPQATQWLAGKIAEELEEAANKLIMDGGRERGFYIEYLHRLAASKRKEQENGNS